MTFRDTVEEWQQDFESTMSAIFWVFCEYPVHRRSCYRKRFGTKSIWYDCGEQHEQEFITRYF